MPLWVTPTSGGGGDVLSVAGRTGHVVLVIADVGGLAAALDGRARLSIDSPVLNLGDLHLEGSLHAAQVVVGAVELIADGKLALSLLPAHTHDDRYYTKAQVDTAIDAIELTPGPQGPQGIQGPAGPAGPGVPVGGSTGQVLAKASNADYDTQWVAPGGGGELPGGGTTGQYLRGDVTWQTLNATAVGLGNVSNALQLIRANNLSDLANAATARTNLGLGTIATQAANNVAITGGSINVTTLQLGGVGVSVVGHGHAISDVTDLGSTLSSHSNSISTLNGQVNGLQTDLSNHASSSLMHLPSSPSEGVLYYNGSSWGTIAASWVSIDDDNSTSYTTYSSDHINSLFSSVNDALNTKANLTGGNTFGGQQTINDLLVVNGPGGAIPTDTILTVGTGFFVRKDGSILAPIIVGQPKWDDVANLASSGATTWDMDQTPVAICNISGALTLTISNPRKRGTYVLRVKNSGAGPYTITWSGTTIVWLPGGTAPTLPTGADKRAVITLVYDGTELLGIATVQS